MTGYIGRTYSWSSVVPNGQLDPTFSVNDVVYSGLSSNKVFGAYVVLTAPALKCFKRYLGDCQAT